LWALNSSGTIFTERQTPHQIFLDVVLVLVIEAENRGGGGAVRTLLSRPNSDDQHHAIDAALVNPIVAVMLNYGQ